MFASWRGEEECGDETDGGGEGEVDDGFEGLLLDVGEGACGCGCGGEELQRRDCDCREGV